MRSFTYQVYAGLIRVVFVTTDNRARSRTRYSSNPMPDISTRCHRYSLLDEGLQKFVRKGRQQLIRSHSRPEVVCCTSSFGSGRQDASDIRWGCKLELPHFPTNSGAPFDALNFIGINGTTAVASRTHSSVIPCAPDNGLEHSYECLWNTGAVCVGMCL